MCSYNNSIRASEMANNEIGTNGIIQSPIVNEHEIRDHFNTCMKMFAENRISIRNAWNLKIIDYMSTILTSEDQSNEVLQMAATSIQAATKIYTIRVDDVHSNTLKLASNLVRTNAHEDEDNVDQKQLDEGDSKQQRTQKRNKRGAKKATVSNDSSTLVGEIPRLPSTIFSNLQDVDMVATNLLSNKVPMHHTGYKFALLSREPAWTSTREKFTIHAKQYPIKIEPIDKVQLCAQFQDFEIDSWDEDEDEEIVLDENSAATSVMYNDEGVPVPELYESIVETFPPDDQEVKKGRATIRNDYCCSSSKYVFGHKEIAQLWAGPNHLKFKSVRKSISGHIENKKQKSDVKRRTAQPINFLTDDIPPLNKLKLCKRKSKTSEEDFDKCTLPQKFILGNSTNSGLMSKPLFICKPNPEFLKEPLTNVGVQNVENDGVKSEESFQDAAFENVSVHEEVVYSNVAAICEDNLIDFPEMVHQDFKGYVAKEKRMNMKYLKRSIWKSLVVQKDAEEMMQKRKFSEVYSELPGKLNKRYRKELSCPQAFVALLHVSNEKNLHLTKIDNENDFHIEKKDDFE